MASADCSSLAAAVAVGAGFHSSGHRTTLRLGMIALMCVVAGGYGARLHAQAVSALCVVDTTQHSSAAQHGRALAVSAAASATATTGQPHLALLDAL